MSIAPLRSSLEVGKDGKIDFRSMREWMRFFDQVAAGAPLVGNGSPEGVVKASVGSLYLRQDGGVGTTLYVKETGIGNTGWSAK